MKELRNLQDNITSKGFKDCTFSIGHISKNCGALEELREHLLEHLLNKEQYSSSSKKDTDVTLTKALAVTTKPSMDAVIIELRVWGNSDLKSIKKAGRDFLDHSIEFFDKDRRGDFNLRFIRNN